MTEAALKAAVKFIQVASQQTVFIAGRSALNDELDKISLKLVSTYILYMYKMYTPDMKTQTIQYKQHSQNGH